jgi:hypothetical protein
LTNLSVKFCAAIFASKAAVSASFAFFNEGVRSCRGFAAGFGLLAVVLFITEERIVACVMVVVFSFADFELFAAVPLGWVFAELEVEEIFLEATMLIC